MEKNYFKVLWNIAGNPNWGELDEICSPSFTVPKTCSSPPAELSIKLSMRDYTYVLQRKTLKGDICVECQAIITGSSATVREMVIKSGKTDSDNVLMNTEGLSVWPPDSVEFRFFGISKTIPFYSISSTYHTATLPHHFSGNTSSIHLIFDAEIEKLKVQPQLLSSSSTKLRVDVTGSNRSIWQYGKCIIYKETEYYREYDEYYGRYVYMNQYQEIIALSPTVNSFREQDLSQNSVSKGNENLILTFSTQSDVFGRNDYADNRNLYKFKFVTALHHILSNRCNTCDVISDNKFSELLSLIEQPLFSDFTLQVQEQKFPVHRNILAVQSPFFKAMFEAELQEKKNMCAELKDIDIETIQHLLRFCYGHVLEDLDVGAASRLYSAADQYQVVEVMRHCSKLLTAKLTIANACNILALTYAHQDNDLKSQVQEFIFNNDKAIMPSETWSCFKEHNKDIALETLEFLYNKKL